MESFIDAWSHSSKDVTYTPKGLAFTDKWGSLRYAGNSIFLMQAYAKELKDPKLKAQVDCLTLQQLNYMLGSTGQSFVVGFGETYPQQPHHRAASCPPDKAEVCNKEDGLSPEPNPHILYGALVGGPDVEDIYDSSRGNYIQNEVTVDYNGGFTGALAAVLDGGWRPDSKACPSFPIVQGTAMPEESAKRLRRLLMSSAN
jgi:endoglucanase